MFIISQVGTLQINWHRKIEIGKIRSMFFLNKSGCDVNRSSNDIDFVLFPTATTVSSPFTTIYINSTIVDAVNHMWSKRSRSSH